jgi:hypothetical protein
VIAPTGLAAAINAVLISDKVAPSNQILPYFFPRVGAAFRYDHSDNSSSPFSVNSLLSSAMVATLASSMIRAAESHSLDRTLEPYLREFAPPALAAAVFKEGVVIASGVTGTRRAGEYIPVRIDDRFTSDRTRSAGEGRARLGRRARPGTGHGRLGHPSR